MTNGNGLQRDDAALEALLRASPAYVRAQRAGGSLENVTPATTPATLQEAPRANHTRVTPEMAAQLSAPLPPEAIDSHPTKAYLSTIRTIFSIERLNQVFGLDGWTYKTEIIENDPTKPMVVLKVTLYACGIVREQFGGNDNPDRGDAYKGAITDALSKICSYLGIGMDVYKGRGPTKTNGGKREAPKPVAAPEPKPVAAAAPAPQPAKPWATFAGMLEEFAKLESLLPTETLREIYADHGVQKAEHFRRGPSTRMQENAATALRCYQKMLSAAAEYQALASDPSTYEHFEASEGGRQ